MKAPSTIDEFAAGEHVADLWDHRLRERSEISVWLSPSWWWAPLEEIVQECSDMRAIGSEGVLPGEPSVFNDEWLPIVIGDGMLVMDTSQSVVAPVYAVDFPDLGADVSNELVVVMAQLLKGSDPLAGPRTEMSELRSRIGVR